MKNGKLQAKDIPDEAILGPLRKATHWLFMFEGSDYYVGQQCYGFPQKVVRAKMNSLIRRGLATGCTCGCRGDFESVPSGINWREGPK